MGAKKLVYIVNKLDVKDSQHFVHIPNLLANLAARFDWKVSMISERGGSGVQIISGIPVRYLSIAGRWSRLPKLAFNLLLMRVRGGRIVFVRISKSAALVSGLLGRIFGWKTLFWQSGTVEDFNKKNSKVGRVGFWGMSLLLRIIDYFVTGPETMVEYYRDTYKLPRNKIIMLYNDISLDFNVGSISGSVDEIQHILMVHRLSPVRETNRYFGEIINSLNEYTKNGNRVVLDIVGDGPERMGLELEAKKANSGLKILFHGSVENSKLKEYYKKATLFIMPSYREGFPRVILEAMAWGIPIVSTDAGGTKDLLGPLQKSFVVNKDDALRFSANIVYLLSKPNILASLRVENLEIVTRYSTPVVAEMYDRELSRVIN